MARAILKSGGPLGAGIVSSEERRHLIAAAAYDRALRRGFRGGEAVEDWLAAERDINRLMRLLQQAKRATRATRPLRGWPRSCGTRFSHTDTARLG